MKATKFIALASAAAIALAACGSDSGSDSSADTTTAADESATTDGGEAAATATCPSELVIQTDWFPELEHGGTYQLIGPDGTADKATVSYSGPIQEQYAVGGIETVTIRTVNADKSQSSVLADGDADMAYITSSDIIKDSAAIPLIGIAKTLDQDPQMIMWDPAQNDIQAPEDLAATGAQVLHFPGTSYIDYMISQGFITADQPNPSYDGSDGTWVAEGGNFIQQGFATNEIYKYENDIAWKDGGPADVSFFTVGDLGFENYPAVITMLQSRAEELDACLTELVPGDAAGMDRLPQRPEADHRRDDLDQRDPRRVLGAERRAQRSRHRAHRVRRLRGEQPRRHVLQPRSRADAGAVRHPPADLRRPGHRGRRQRRRCVHEQVLRRRTRPLTGTPHN